MDPCYGVAQWYSGPMQKVKALGLCGSLRGESWNLKLLRNFLGALDSGPFTTRLYGALDLPLINEDLEKKPLPKSILDLRAAMEESQVVILATPEYNGSLSPVLKNAIDWASRPPANLWTNKIAVLLSASPGALGGARGLIQLRTCLATTKTWVIPEQVQCSVAHQAFDGTGLLKAEAVQKQILGAKESLEAFCGKMLSG